MSPLSNYFLIPASPPKSAPTLVARSTRLFRHFGFATVGRLRSVVLHRAGCAMVWPLYHCYMPLPAGSFPKQWHALQAGPARSCASNLQRSVATSTLEPAFVRLSDRRVHNVRGGHWYSSLASGSMRCDSSAPAIFFLAACTLPTVVDAWLLSLPSLRHWGAFASLALRRCSAQTR